MGAEKERRKSSFYLSFLSDSPLLCDNAVLTVRHPPQGVPRTAEYLITGLAKPEFDY